MRRISWISAFLIAVNLLCAATHEPATLDSIKAVYQESLANMEKAYVSYLSQINDPYQASLTAVIKTIKTDGDLGALIKVKEEEKRFLSEKTVPEDLTSAHPLVAKAQREYRRMTANLTQSVNLKKIQLLSSYIQRLDKLKHELVKKEDIENGLAVKQEQDQAEETLRLLKSEMNATSKSSTSEPAPVVVSAPKPVHHGARLRLPGTLTDALLLYYSFDDLSGNEVKDLSGNEYHGQVLGATHTRTGKLRGGLAFNGKSFVKIQPDGVKSHVPIGAGDFSIFMWINPDQVDAEMMLFSQANGMSGHAPQSGFNFGITSKGTLMLQMIGGFNFRGLSEASIAAYKRQWTHIGLVARRGKDATFYINGKVADTIDMSQVKVRFMGAKNKSEKSAHFDTVGSRTRAGRFYPKIFFDGTMDEFMIFTRALTEEDVQQTYLSTGGR